MTTAVIFVGNTTEILVIVLCAIIVAAAAILYSHFTRSKRLRDRFGPEYDRTVEQTGTRRKAEARLERLEKRVERLHIRPIEPVERARFEKSWRQIQARFVDSPNAAVLDADRMLGEVMAVAGYPVLDFEQQTADISVDHPRVVENYREGHRIALLEQQGRASTEDLRKAIIHYRTLFDDLIGSPNPHDAPQELSQESTR